MLRTNNMIAAAARRALIGPGPVPVPPWAAAAAFRLSLPVPPPSLRLSFTASQGRWPSGLPDCQGPGTAGWARAPGRCRALVSPILSLPVRPGPGRRQFPAGRGRLRWRGGRGDPSLSQSLSHGRKSIIYIYYVVFQLIKKIN